MLGREPEKELSAQMPKSPPSCLVQPTCPLRSDTDRGKTWRHQTTPPGTRWCARTGRVTCASLPMKHRKRVTIVQPLEMFLWRKLPRDKCQCPARREKHGWMFNVMMQCMLDSSSSSHQDRSPTKRRQKVITISSSFFIICMAGET